MTRVALALFLTQANPVLASLEEAEQALRAGRYEEALEAFESESSRTPTARLYRGWIEALRLTGQAGEALETIAAFLEREPASAELENTRGELLFERGRIEEARVAFGRAFATGATDALTAELNLAILLHDDGEVDEALRRFDRFIDVYNRSSSLSSEDLIAVGIACRYLGATNKDLFKDARNAFHEAQAKDPSAHEPAILVGGLFLEKYESTFATEFLQKVLAVNPNHPEALLGMARVKAFDRFSEAMVLTEKALEIRPDYVAARAFLAEQLLGLENYERAREEAERALETNPVSPEALPILAASELLSGNLDAFRAVEARALARNPRHADFYNTLSDIAVNNRLYVEASDFASKAVALDERSWWGHRLLGLNELRLGRIEEGVESLERSFEGDPYNVWVKNTLDLLDTYPDYVTTTTDKFEIFVQNKEAALLSGYVEAIAAEAYEKLAERYEFRPQTPIRIEVYPSHADFSVRTLGLPGLGALGVCFGSVIVVDSPSARPKGQFNWASTLWHELGHTVTLGVTDHRVPRWFSEGLSVLEERRARPGWGDDANIAFLAAYERGKLLPIAELNNGFMRPTHPQQIGISYYQASLVSELIEQDHGFQAIRDMLAGYREGLPTEKVFQKVLSLELEEFDALFETYLKERFESVAKALRLPDEGESKNQSPEELRARAEKDEHDFFAHLETGRLALADGDAERAERHLERAKELFPGYGEAKSPYLLLARIHREKGDSKRAARELRSFVDINENHYDAHIELAELYESMGEKEDAAAILERAIYIYPFDADAHRQLVGLLRGIGRFEDVVVERRALLALTTDKAQGFYELAVAYREAGDAASARRELLRALEIAPVFRDGLSLLLELSNESSEP